MGGMVALVLLILIVFIGAGIGLAVYMAKRSERGNNPLASLQLPGMKQESAKVGAQLVAADDALRDAKQELEFASASLSADQLAAINAALADAETKVRQAFALKQQLDSPTVAANDKPRLTEQIFVLAADADRMVGEQLEALKALTATSATWSDSAAQLTKSLDAIDQRADAARPIAAQLASDYSEKVSADAGAKLDQAKDLTGLARQSLAIASTKGEAGDIAGAREPLRAAQQAAQRADALVAGVEQLPEQLVATQLSLATTLAQAQAEVKTITDGAHASDGESAAALSALNELIATLPLSGKSPDPVADLEALRAAQAKLGRSTGSVGKAQMTPQQARSALSGTLMAAKQHLAAVDDAVAARPASVGADARVKAGQARELIRQAQDAASNDPVKALELAWQADQHAVAAQQAL